MQNLRAKLLTPEPRAKRVPRNAVLLPPPLVAPLVGVGLRIPRLKSKPELADKRRNEKQTSQKSAGNADKSVNLRGTHSTNETANGIGTEATAATAGTAQRGGTTPSPTAKAATAASGAEKLSCEDSFAKLGGRPTATPAHAGRTGRGHARSLSTTAKVGSRPTKRGLGRFRPSGLRRAPTGIGVARPPATATTAGGAAFASRRVGAAAALCPKAGGTAVSARAASSAASVTGCPPKARCPSLPAR